MNKESVWLDANLILRFLRKDHPQFFKAAYNLFARAEHGELELYIHPLTLAEVVWTLQGYYGHTKQEIAAVLGNLIGSDGLFVVDKVIAEKALKDFAERNVDYIDAYLAAYAKVNGPETVYTLDKKHFSRLEGDIRMLP